MSQIILNVFVYLFQYLFLPVSTVTHSVPIFFFFFVLVTKLKPSCLKACFFHSLARHTLPRPPPTPTPSLHYLPQYTVLITERTSEVYLH